MCKHTETASIWVICVLTERQEHVTLTCCLSLTASPSSLPPSIHVCMFDLSRSVPLHKATAGSMVSFDIGPWAICVRYVGRKRLAVLELVIKPLHLCRNQLHAGCESRQLYIKIDEPTVYTSLAEFWLISALPTHFLCAVTTAHSCQYSPQSPALMPFSASKHPSSLVARGGQFILDHNGNLIWWLQIKMVY